MYTLRDEFSSTSSLSPRAAVGDALSTAASPRSRGADPESASRHTHKLTRGRPRLAAGRSACTGQATRARHAPFQTASFGRTARVDRLEARHRSQFRGAQALPSVMADSDDSIRFLAYGRLSDGLLLATHKSRRASTATEETCKKVFESGNLKPNAQLTVTVTPEIGTLHLNAGGEDVIAVVTATTYPRKPAFELLDAVRVEVTRASITTEDVRNAEKPGCFARSLFLKDVCARFEEADQADKVARVGAQVHEVQVMMEGNINRMLDNQETVGAVEDKSEALRQGASQFNRRSAHVRRMLWWRLLKLKIIFGLLAMCVLGYIFVPIIVQAT